MSPNNCLVVLGPTASGKTKMAASLALKLDAEIISADSRQVYRQLNIGTGKDLNEYHFDEKIVPVHLIDLANPEEQFYLHDFIVALQRAFTDIRARTKIPIICGGTGLYLDALEKNFELTQIPENEILRRELATLSSTELNERLSAYPTELTYQVDLHSTKRLIRGIEIAEHLCQHGLRPKKFVSPYSPFYIGITNDRVTRRAKIEARLQQRFSEGLIEEVEQLLAGGLSNERLQRLGLEYKFLALYLSGKITRTELEQQLVTAIQQFAKRQMTWFRKMERSGIKIHWVHSECETEQLIALIKNESSLLG
jgi:tRNA dimethylallyltransferase